jgi:hypothetical protein
MGCGAKLANQRNTAWLSTADILLFE